MYVGKYTSPMDGMGMSFGFATNSIFVCLLWKNGECFRKKLVLRDAESWGKTDSLANFVAKEL